MKTRSVFLVLVLVSCLSNVMVVSDGWAQGKQKYSGSKPGTAKSKYTQTHVIDVGDVPGHQLRIFELQTVYTDEPPTYDGVKVKERIARGFSEYTEGSGAGMAYAIVMLENGDRIFERMTLHSQTVTAPDGSKKLSYRSVSILTGGTGRFKGIRGTLLGGGGSDLKTGLTAPWTEGEYWFEK